MPTEPTAVEWISQLRSREISSRELAEHYLARIETINPGLNAIVATDPQALLEAADQADAQLRADAPGSLLGLPITVKDSLEVTGFAATGGSYGRRDYRPEKDATAVARARAAGALILGKTNLPELAASYETDNSLFGRTNNPFATEHTSGGSSGGEAASIGADISPIGLGTDGGGSIRLPAHFCGIFGLRPTVGRVPETGTWPASRHSGYGDFSCVGPMGRSTADLALLLEVIAGPDLIDPYAHPVALRDRREVATDSLRVGFYDDDAFAPPSSEVRAAVATAVEALREANARIEDVIPPRASEATRLFFSCVGASGGADLFEHLEGTEGHHSPEFEQFLSLMSVRTPPASEYFSILREVFELRSQVRRWIADYDVIIAPVCAGPAPVHGMPPAGYPQSEFFEYRAYNYTHFYSLAGLPALAVPILFARGLPVGVQVVANPWREDVALAVSQMLEDALGGYQIGRS